ncbi:uncharacterized protein LOC129589863 [Paramacrobiotus metropolitanus]|uniref:uncharacterized protein LOC129589863 n=1 Tax=Paramacrobiotus metropolitanus TaxID=2943436 RepID=UPI002445C869|nr:uncharacterized protein LOC129589863 [Paramacrobiotus metropolitanus]
MAQLSVSLIIWTFLLCLKMDVISCVIQVYRTESGNASQELVYTVPNDYQLLAGQLDTHRPVYLIVSESNNSNSSVGVADFQHATNQSVPQFVLLSDFTECSTDAEFAARILNVQNKGYDGVLIYCNTSINRTRTGNSNWQRCSHFLGPDSFPIMAVIRNQTNIAVHLVTPMEAAELKRFGFTDDLSQIRYTLNFTLATPSSRVNTSAFIQLKDIINRTRSSISQYRNLYPGISASSSRTLDSQDWYNRDVASRSSEVVVSRWTPPVTTPATSYRVYRRSYSGSWEYSLLAVIAGIFGLVIRCCCCVRKQRKIFRNSRRSQRLTDEEIAEILAIREIIVRRLIARLVAEAEAEEAAEQEHRAANGTPLTEAEMERLGQVEATEALDDLCPTCQQNFTEGEFKVVLPCNHAGHKACLATWLTTYSRNCPVCRQAVEYSDVVNSANMPATNTEFTVYIDV